MVSILPSTYFSIENFDEEIDLQKQNENNLNNENENVNTTDNTDTNKTLSEKITDLSNDVKTEKKTYDDYKYDDNNILQSLLSEYKISMLDITDKILDGKTSEITNDTNTNKKFSNTFYIIVTIVGIILLIFILILLIKVIKKSMHKKS